MCPKRFILQKSLYFKRDWGEGRHRVDLLSCDELAANNFV